VTHDDHVLFAAVAGRLGRSELDPELPGAVELDGSTTGERIDERGDMKSEHLSTLRRRGQEPNDVDGGYDHRVQIPLLDPGHDDDGKIDGMQVHRVHDPGYPAALLALGDHPAVLYVAGEIMRCDDNAVAVVGSRRASPTAIADATAIGRGLAQHGRTVISGLAVGVDSAAHRGALSIPGGRTIAVVGTGLNLTFPAQNAALDRLIRSRGAVVSQFPPGERPSKTTFPARNALIAGLAVASVIVVAEERSGTRIEIDHTIAQGKPVVFWAPLMRSATWAHDIVDMGAGFFAEAVGDIVERLAVTR
jgi:DNA processing protein